MSKEDYVEYLRDSRWQDKRNIILKRDSYKCTNCGGINSLHVHHLKYSGKYPWNAPDKDLKTLCRWCHEKVHGIKNKNTKYANIKVEKFYITYPENLYGYIHFTSNTDKIILMYMCSVLEYDTGRVFIKPAERLSICKMFDLSLQQFSNSISKLKKLYIIIGKNGFYTINPIMFWKGSNEARLKLLTDKKFAENFNFELID